MGIAVPLLVFSMVCALNGGGTVRPWFHGQDSALGMPERLWVLSLLFVHYALNLTVNI